jgi:hypothetical protein
MTRATTQRRWYDNDPILLEVVNLMSLAPEAAQQYAQRLIDGVEKQVDASLLENLYAKLDDPNRPKNRWYDDNPVVCKALELLRLLPHEAQRTAALQMIESLKSKQGTAYTILMETFSPKINTLVLDEELETDEAHHV